MSRWCSKFEIIVRDVCTQYLPIRTATKPPTDSPMAAEHFIVSDTGMQVGVHSTEHLKPTALITYLRTIVSIELTCHRAICLCVACF
jgi:hypothetical protein